MLRAEGIHPGGRKSRSNSPESRCSTGSTQRAQGTSNLPLKAALEPDVGDNLLGTAMLMQHLGAPLGGQIAQLLRLAAIADRLGELELAAPRKML
jgi:hypothetical protein